MIDDTGEPPDNLSVEVIVTSARIKESQEARNECVCFVSSYTHLHYTK